MKEQSTFLKSYYTLMRYVDDIVDRNAPLPVRFQSSVEFVEKKLILLNMQQIHEILQIV